MYFVPNGNIYILRFVPLDNTYTNTLFFNSREEQIEYFTNKAKLKLEKQTYTRIERGKIRIEQNAENLYDCNYLMFQNKDFGEQWFYAFINNIEYLNNYTSEIEFELDVMQTWYWNYTLGQCLVEREHSLTDKAGDNLIEESYPVGDLVQRDLKPLVLTKGTYYVVLAASTDPESKNAIAQPVNGIVSGVAYYKTEINRGNMDMSVINFRNLIDNFVGSNSVDSIVNLTAVPTELFNIPKVQPSERVDFQDAEYRAPKTQEVSIQRPDNISGYVPKNKKLLCYPYNFFIVSTGKNVKTYRWEYFMNHEETVSFKVTGLMGTMPQCALTPLNYLNTEENYSEELILDSFPQLAFSVDMFKAFVAQRALPTFASALVGVVTAGAGAVTANPAMVASGIGGAVNTLVSQIPAAVSAATTGAIARGDNTEDIDFVRNIKTFMWARVECRQQQLKCIDDYFTMYGYATNQIKVPNIGTRPYFNYVKLNTVNFVWNTEPYTTSIPQDSLRKIISIYQNGITFWKTNCQVGDYSVNNSPTEE